jgi:hypothetical protein
MPSDARPQSESAVPSTSSRVGDTLQVAAGSSRASGSYELHPLAPKESIAPAEAIPHDGSDESDCPAGSSLRSHRQNMSRAPLLVRSSPAQGTGSYGGLPILSVSSSPDDSDDHHVTRFFQRGKRKGKSKLRHSEPAQRPSSVNQSHDDSVRSEAIFTDSRARRRSARDESAALLDDASEAQKETGLRTRSSARSLGPSSIGASRVFEGLQSSSTSSQIEGAEDDEESSEGEDLLDVKDHSHPSDNSPYAHVRASVAATDDLSLSINTPRMWALSILFAILGSSTNLFFSLRYPSVSITPIIALLLVHPLGLLWDQLLKRSGDPDETFVNGARQSETGSVYTNGSRPTSGHSSHLFQPKSSWGRRTRLWLAQGRWNAKEHCCVYISSNVSFGFAFATDVSTTRYQKHNADICRSL